MPVAYKCRGCGAEYLKKWSGRCPNEVCRGHYDIRQVASDAPGAEMAEVADGEPVPLQDAADRAIIIPRIETGIVGIDHVLSGGFAHNSVTLLCGDPGVGKTSILIQIFREIARRRYDTLYITGEQSINDIALTAKRFGRFPAKMLVARETDLGAILDILEERKPAVVAIDSAQTIVVADDFEPGSTVSIKAAIRELMDHAKRAGTAVVVIGHVTKSGGIGGPRALEHYVDTCLYMAGNKNNPVRYLKCDTKNRFGETPRHARFLMTEVGLVDSPVDPTTEDLPEEDEDEIEDSEKCLDKKPPTKTSKRLSATTSAPTLRSVPAEPDQKTPKKKPLDGWVAADGTSEKVVLAVACDVPDCAGKIDRACSSENGVKEAGFHQSRVTKAKLRIVTPPQEVEEEKEKTVAPPDPFAKKPLGAPPRIKPKRRPAKKKPEPEQRK